MPARQHSDFMERSRITLTVRSILWKPRLCCCVFVFGVVLQSSTVVGSTYTATFVGSITHQVLQNCNVAVYVENGMNVGWVNCGRDGGNVSMLFVQGGVLWGRLEQG